MVDSTRLFQAVFHSLEQHIALIDGQGQILETNTAWNTFAIDNGLQPDHGWKGVNYFECTYLAYTRGDLSAEEILQGMRSVVLGVNPEFRYEYPCHSSREERWFMMCFRPVLLDSETPLFTISHQNVTRRYRAESISLIDELTGIANRRAFHVKMERALNQARAEQQPLSLMFIDLDNFKAYNDTRGHAAGDQCLKKVSRILQREVATRSGMLARIGGDEFACILSDTDETEAQRLAERAKNSVRALGLYSANDIQVTASIGLLSVTPDEKTSMRSMMKRADNRLYKAKSRGKDQLVT